MIAAGKPHGLASFCLGLFGLSVRHGEPEMGVGQEYADTIRVPVHDGLLMSDVPDSQHPHTIVLEFDVVVFRVDFDGVGIDCRLRFWFCHKRRLLFSKEHTPKTDWEQTRNRSALSGNASAHVAQAPMPAGSRLTTCNVLIQHRAILGGPRLSNC